MENGEFRIKLLQVNASTEQNLSTNNTLVGDDG